MNSNPESGVAFGSTVFGTIAFGLWCYLGAGTGTYAAATGFFTGQPTGFSLLSFFLDEGLAILFTVVAWAIWLKPNHYGVVGAGVSIAVDIASIFQDVCAAKDLLGGSDDILEWGTITFSSDMAADLADIVASGIDIHTAVYG